MLAPLSPNLLEMKIGIQPAWSAVFTSFPQPKKGPWQVLNTHGVKGVKGVKGVEVQAAKSWFYHASNWATYTSFLGIFSIGLPRKG